MAITKQQLESFYVGQNLTIRQCAEALGLPTSGGISWWLKKFGIIARPGKFQVGNQINKGTIHDWKGGKKIVPCTNCGRELSRFPSLIFENNFCNQSCKGEWQGQDMTGKKVGLLTFIKKAGKDKHNHIQWECLCDCGEKKLIKVGDIKNGVKSCGCLLHAKGESNHSWKGGKIEVSCANPKCNKMKLIYPSYEGKYKTFYCSQKCHGEHVIALESRKGKSSPLYVARVKVPCAYCGKAIDMTPNKQSLYQKFFCKDTNCMGKWREENTKGQLNPNWKGGMSYEPYPVIFADRRFKAGIRERDNHTCQNPECPRTNSILTIHHIDYDKGNCDSINLITLCNNCNSRANANREFWEAGYREIIRIKYQADEQQVAV